MCGRYVGNENSSIFYVCKYVHKGKPFSLAQEKCLTSLALNHIRSGSRARLAGFSGRLSRSLSIEKEEALAPLYIVREVGNQVVELCLTMLT